MWPRTGAPAVDGVFCSQVLAGAPICLRNKDACEFGNAAMFYALKTVTYGARILAEKESDLLSESQILRVAQKFGERCRPPGL